MTTVAFLVVISSLVALLVVGIEDIASGHIVFANRGINVQTDTNQDQGCEYVGGTSGITNACTATSGRSATQTRVALTFSNCSFAPGSSFRCNTPSVPNFCNNIGCTSISCASTPAGPANCTTDNGVQLTSCTQIPGTTITCTLSETGTGITNSGGVTGGDAG